MAREFAVVWLSMWSDDDFRSLTPEEQHLYLVLVTSPTLSHCGVADWRPPRIAKLAQGWTPERVEAAGGGLVDKLYILVDPDTEEALVRSFIRRDGLMKQPNMAVAMSKAHTATASQALRSVIVWELQRLAKDQPELPSWSAKASGQILTDLLAKASVDPSTYPLGNPFVNPSVKGSGNPSGRARSKGSVKGSGNPSPTPSPSPAPTSSTHTAPTERAPQGAVVDPDAGVNLRGQALAKAYCDAVPLSKFPSIFGIAKKAIKAGLYTDEQIGAALSRLAGEGRSVTTDTLRVELEGLPPARTNGRRVGQPAQDPGFWSQQPHLEARS